MRICFDLGGVIFRLRRADANVDDNAFRFTGSNGVDDDGANLAIGRERRLGERDDLKTRRWCHD